MRAIDVQIIEQELAVRWDDGGESFIPLEKLRLACPCAVCKGETDVMGRLQKPATEKLTDRAFRLLRIAKVGGYAIQIVWGDGHNTGLYSFEYLRSVADAPMREGGGA